MQPPYTGKNGFYSSVFPIDQGIGTGINQIRAIVKQASGFTLRDPRIAKDDKDDIGFHLTVMYSKSALGCTPFVAYETVRKMQGPIQVKATKFDYWDGHDNEGYLVLKLDAPDLERWHQVWKSLGAVPTFEPYEPHITLVQGEDARTLSKQVVQLTASLIARLDVRLLLGNTTITDLKN